MDLVMHKFQWKLKNFNKESVAMHEGSGIISETFEASYQQNKMLWKLNIKIQKSALSVYLNKVGDYSFADTIIFKAFVIDNNGAEKYNFCIESSIEFWPDPSKCRGGFLTNCDVFLNEPERYLENGTLKIGCEIFFKKHEDTFKRYLGSTDVEKALDVHKQYFNSEIYSDFTITCSDGIDIPAHNMILAAHSDVFQSMINAPMTESRDQKVVIEDIDSETMLEILRFIYLRKVEKLDELKTKIYYGAHKYEIEELKRLCVTSMIDHLSAENVIEYFILADKYSESHLLKKCLQFITINYRDLRSRDVIKDVGSVRLMQIITDYLSEHLPLVNHLTSTL